MHSYPSSLHGALDTAASFFFSVSDHQTGWNQREIGHGKHPVRGEGRRVHVPAAVQSRLQISRYRRRKPRRWDCWVILSFLSYHSPHSDYSPASVYCFARSFNRRISHYRPGSASHASVIGHLEDHQYEPTRRLSQRYVAETAELCSLLRIHVTESINIMRSRQGPVKIPKSLQC